MTMTYEQMMALANQAAAVGEDMTEAVVGGSAKPLPIGNFFGRLVEVVELGQHPQKDFKTKAFKGNANEIHLAFALWGTGKNATTGEPETIHNDDGSPRIFAPFPMTMSRNDGSKAFKLFQKLNWKNDKTNFAQLLNTPFIIPFTLQDKSKTDKTQVVKPYFDGILPPLDPINQTPYNVPEFPVEQLKLFLWDFPNKAMWDSLYIEGEWAAKDGKPAESKNKLQNQIMSAVNFQGSPLQLLLSGGGAALPDLSAPPAQVAAPLAVAQPGPVAVPAATPVAPVAAVPAIGGKVAAPLAVPAAAPAAVPAAVPVGVPAIATPAVPVMAVPSSPVLPV